MRCRWRNWNCEQLWLPNKTLLSTLQNTNVSFAPYAAVSADPFASVALDDNADGTSYACDTDLPVRASIGESLAAFPAGPTAYFDTLNVFQVKLYGEVYREVCRADPVVARACRGESQRFRRSGDVMGQANPPRRVP